MQQLPECPNPAPPKALRRVSAGWCCGASVTAGQAKMRRELRFTYCKGLLKYTQEKKSKLISKLINTAVASLGHFVYLAHLVMYCTSTLHPLPAFSSVAGRQAPALHSEIAPQKTPKESKEGPSTEASLLYSSLALFIAARNCQIHPRHPCKVTPDMSFVPRYVTQSNSII